MYLLELKKGAIYKTCLTQSNNIVSALYFKKTTNTHYSLNTQLLVIKQMPTIN